MNGVKDTPTFHGEVDGWSGYVEWEKYPEKKTAAHKALLSEDNNFDPIPEFQLKLLPDSNPLVEGKRWKQYHSVLGEPLAGMPASSWDTVSLEKAQDMQHVLEFPYNGEPPKAQLLKNMITPTKYLFVRNHGGIPDIPAAGFSVEIDGLVNKPQRISLDLLQDSSVFEPVTVTATIQCSGNRRFESQQLFPGGGDELINAPWTQGAIGTARWTGVPLKKVIKYCGGLKEGGKHIEFFGADTYFKNLEASNYMVSVPWIKVKSKEVLLVWNINGEPLPRAHGYPLRILVLGYIGARSVKWLYRIRAIAAPSTAPVQRVEYLHYNHQMSKYNGDYTRGISIQEMPVSSVILSPLEKDLIVHSGHIKVAGWAFSGGGHWPEMVEVSGDGGFSWFPVPRENMSKKYRHAWRLWQVELPVTAEGWIELRCRCWDNALNSQPGNIRDTWNWSTHMVNHQHRIQVLSVNKGHEATRQGLENLKLQDDPLLPITHSAVFRGKAQATASSPPDQRDPDE